MEPAQTDLSAIAADDTYRISKPIVSKQLVASIKLFGVLRPPAAFVSSTGLVLLTGHNRVAAAREACVSQIPVYVYPSSAAQVLRQEALFKSYHREISPAGKLKALGIEATIFGADEHFLSTLGKELAVPEDFLLGTNFETKPFESIELFNQLPDSIKNYFDIHDIAFKIIADYMRLHRNLQEALSLLAERIKIRADVFRKITELAAELAAANPAFDITVAADEVLSIGSEDADTRLCSKLFALRYPEYSAMKQQADIIAAKINGSGVKADFPEFFEGGKLKLSVELKKREGAAAFFRKAESVCKEDLQTLLNML